MINTNKGASQKAFTCQCIEYFSNFKGVFTGIKYFYYMHYIYKCNIHICNILHPYDSIENNFKLWPGYAAYSNVINVIEFIM